MFLFHIFFSSKFCSCTLSVHFDTFAQVTALKVNEVTVPMNSPLTLLVDSFDVDQCGRCSSGHPHLCVPMLSIAEIANCLPEVNIFTHLLSVYSEFLVVRSNTMINQLVSDQPITESLSVKDKRGADHVQYQHWSFDKVRFVIDGGAYH